MAHPKVSKLTKSTHVLRKLYTYHSGQLHRREAQGRVWGWRECRASMTSLGASASPHVKWSSTWYLLKTCSSGVFIKSSFHRHDRLRHWWLNLISILSCVHACSLSCFSHVRLSVTLWTVAHQAPLSMGFSRQEYWSGLPCPPPGDLPEPEIEPVSLMSLVSCIGRWVLYN